MANLLSQFLPIFRKSEFTSVCEEPGYAILSLSPPEMNSSEVFCAIQKVAGLRLRGCKKVLLHDRAKNWKLDTASILSLIENLRWFDVFDVKAALVSEDLQRLSDLRFAETVGFNRGYEIQAFNNLEVAKNWLLSED